VQQMIPVRDTLYGLHQKYFLKLSIPPWIAAQD